MRFSKIFHVYDSHTAGNSTRLLLEGVPLLQGETMQEKKLDFQRHHDQIRTTLTQEPRGNSGILAVLVPACDPKADYGVIFSDYRGYVDVCIHGTIGVVTTLVECGLVPERILKRGIIDFETSAGIIHTKFKISSAKRVESVTVSNVPSFFVKDTQIEVSGFGKVSASIAFGGNFYAYVNAKDLGFEIIPAKLDVLLSAGRQFLKELKKIKIVHPENPNINGIVGVSFYEDLGVKRARNVMIAEDDLFDRSPCGTGTCGRLAVLNAKGVIRVGETLRNRSIIGTEFKGRIARRSKVRGNEVILPEVTGTAYLTGISDLIVSEGDALAQGYTVRR